MKQSFCQLTTKNKRTSYQQRLIPFLLILSIFMFELSTDIYIPCLPEMTSYFGVKESITQMTLSSYMLGYALLGCLAGPLSDSFGRRSIFLGGAVTFSIGSLGCSLAFSITSLIVARFVQGIGVGICVIIANAIVKDSFDERNCSRILSRIWMTIAISPMIAPIFGAAIASAYGWNLNFILIAGMACLLTIIVMILLPETLPPQRRSVFQGWKIIKTYFALLSNLHIICYALISAFVYTGLWLWLTFAPFYIINKLGIKSTDYGYYSAILPLSFVVGTIFNQRFVGRLGVDILLKLGIFVSLGGVIFLVIVSVLFPRSVFSIYGALSFYAVGMAPIFSSAATKTLDVAPNQRGAAAALLNTLELGIASLSIFIISLINNGSFFPLALCILLFIAGCYLILCRVQKRSNTKNESLRSFKKRNILVGLSKYIKAENTNLNGTLKGFK
jgi:DHA1 family bicyclomycin/chloramphenicol resistance-like MFS transporter